MAGAGIITFLHNNNYGSALQAYALQRTSMVRVKALQCILRQCFRKTADSKSNVTVIKSHIYFKG